MNELGDEFVYQDKILFTYFKNKWYENDDDIAKLVSKIFMIEFIGGIMKHQHELLTEALHKNENIESINSTLKLLKKALLKTKNIITLNNIIASLKIDLAGRLDKVCFDTSLPDVLCFTNCAFDVINNKPFKNRKTPLHYPTHVL